MKRKKLIYTLAITLALSVVMIMGMAQITYAESDEVTGYCYFDGKDVVCDFDSNVVVKTVKGLEPGDDVTAGEVARHADKLMYADKHARKAQRRS